MIHAKELGFSNNSKYYLVMFLIWPFLTFFAAIINYRDRQARGFVFLFLLYYGFSFIVVHGQDSSRYVETFLFYSQLPFSELLNVLNGYYTYSGERAFDILEPLITFIVSRFTTVSNFLFGVYAALFSFFYLKSINLLYDHYKQNPNFNALVFLIFFTLIIPVTSIYNPRMWTAAWIFFYGSYHILRFGKLSYFLITLSACLMHWSLFSLNILLFLYYLFGNRNKIYVPVVLVSFIIPEILNSFINQFASFFGGSIESRFSSYTGEAYTEVFQQQAQQASWFMALNYDFVYYFLIITIIVIQVLSRDIQKTKLERNSFSFILLFIALVNFGRPLPAFGWRMQIIFMLFASMYIILLALKLKENNLKVITLVGMFPMLLYSVINLRIGLETVNAWIFAPGIGLSFLGTPTSLAEILFN